MSTKNVASNCYLSDSFQSDEKSSFKRASTTQSCVIQLAQWVKQLCSFCVACGLHSRFNVGSQLSVRLFRFVALSVRKHFCPYVSASQGYSKPKKSDFPNEV